MFRMEISDSLTLIFQSSFNILMFLVTGSQIKLSKQLLEQLKQGQLLALVSHTKFTWLVLPKEASQLLLNLIGLAARTRLLLGNLITIQSRLVISQLQHIPTDEYRCGQIEVAKANLTQKLVQEGSGLLLWDKGDIVISHFLDVNSRVLYRL